MKWIILCLLFLPLVLSASDTTKVYVFDIKEEIAPPIWKKTQKAINKAHELETDLILIRMNTYGGLVDAADSIRTKILNSRIPVYVLIENNAASAGALIAIACDSIYMQPGSTIGAATVVDQSGQQVPDKYQSYMRKKMRATAEENGRDPDIAEAMVDPDKVVPGVSDSGKVITFSTTEAIKYGFCEKEISSVAEIFDYIQIENYRLVEHQETTTDKIIGWLINPAISGILIMIIIGGIYFELQTPGLGFPIVAAAISAVLYFAPLYLEGLAANWEIVLFIVGIGLLLVELFAIPGFGVAGIAGIIAIVTGLTLSLVGNIGFSFEGIQLGTYVEALLTVILSSTLSIAISIYFGTKFIKTKLFAHLILEDVQNRNEGYIGTTPGYASLVGEEGVAMTVLRPSGKVEIRDEVYDATSEEGYIEKGTPVKVLRYSSAQLFVIRK